MSGGGGGSNRDDGYVVPTKPVSPKPSSGGASQPGGGGGSGAGSGADPCDIVQTAPLNSPQPAVVSRLSISDALDVVLGGVPTRPILEVRDKSGSVAGSLTHRGHIAIINCINQGNSYVAVVVVKSGAIVTVRVQRR